MVSLIRLQEWFAINPLILTDTKEKCEKNNSPYNESYTQLPAEYIKHKNDLKSCTSELIYS